MKELELRREIYTDISTIGRLFIGNEFECYTLEDQYREQGVKIYGKTAIPEGKYEVIIDWSTHFKRDMPHILGVPNFSGVRIHAGNSDTDTQGCVLVGKTREVNWIGESRIAFDGLFQKLQRLLAEQKVFINVVRGPSEPG